METSKTATPYFVEDSVEFSFGSKSLERRQLEDEYEYDDEYDRIDNGLGADYDFDEPLQPLIPLKYTATLSASFTEQTRNSDNDVGEVDGDGEHREQRINAGELVADHVMQHPVEDVSDIASSCKFGLKADAKEEEEEEEGKEKGEGGDDDDDDDGKKHEVEVDDTTLKTLSDDVLELFFNTFLDCELEGEITVCQWMTALDELGVDLTEKDMYRVFKHISCDGCYIDAVDFAKFCQRKEEEVEIRKLQATLYSAIMQHPFVDAVQ